MRLRCRDWVCVHESPGAVAEPRTRRFAGRWRHGPAGGRQTVLKRAVCSACLRPATTCLCRWVRPVASAVEVVILQHPLEVHQAKGSARLLHLSLEGSRIVTGEVFAPADLAMLLQGTPGAAQRQPVLLYPETADERSLGLEAPPALDPGALAQPASLRLVVLDGTWRKSRKMLYLNPLLQQLPRLSLRDTGASRYRIRKAEAADQLSTLEASCLALMQIDPPSEKYSALLQAFDGFVEQQITMAALRSAEKN